MRRLFVLAAVVLCAAPPFIGARAQEEARPTVTMYVNSSAGALFAQHPFYGIGVYPESRDARVFLREVSAGSPTSDVSGTRGVAGSLGIALQAAGIRVRAYGVDASILIWGRPDRGEQGGPPKLGASGEGLVVVSPPHGRPACFTGAGALLAEARRTPVFYALQNDAGCSAVRPGGGSARGSITRRPSIVTPYDISATLLARFSVPPPPSFLGRPLTFVEGGRPEPRPLGARLERDDSYQQSLTAWTVCIGLGFGFVVAFGLALAGRPSLARRLTTGASFATAGFLAGLFIPSARGDVRASGVILGLVVGVMLRPGDRERFVAATFTVVAACTSLIAVASALNPGGEPGLSFWGNPLVSWRFFGLLNYQAAFVAGGAVVGLTALRATPWAVAAGVCAGLAVVGAPLVGSNFVGVLTLAFGGALAFLAVHAQEIKRVHFLYAGAFALVAFVGALGVDSIVGASHGARVAGEIGGGGISTLIDLTVDRLRLNLRAIRAFPGGIVLAVIFAVFFATMIRWGFKDRVRALALRAAIVAGSSAGLAALVLEDSGFKTSAVLGFPGLMLWTLAIIRPASEAPVSPDTMPHVHVQHGHA